MVLYYIGNYTCKAANTQPATVQVYVSDGKSLFAYVVHTFSRFAKINGGLNFTLKICHIVESEFIYYNIVSELFSTTEYIDKFRPLYKLLIEVLFLYLNLYEHSEKILTKN